MSSPVHPPPSTIPVAILGCTGVVGQKFISLLRDHPYFHIVCLCASERSAGKLYSDVVSWKLNTTIPPHVGALTVQQCDVKIVQQTQATVVFSALDASVAGQHVTPLPLLTVDW